MKWAQDYFFPARYHRLVRIISKRSGILKILILHREIREIYRNGQAVALVLRRGAGIYNSRGYNTEPAERTENTMGFLNRSSSCAGPQTPLQHRLQSCLFGAT